MQTGEAISEGELLKKMYRVVETCKQELEKIMEKYRDSYVVKSLTVPMKVLGGLLVEP